MNLKSKEKNKRKNASICLGATNCVSTRENKNDVEGQTDRPPMDKHIYVWIMKGIRCYPEF